LNEQTRAKAGLIYNVAMTVVTSLMVFGAQWMMTTMWDITKQQAAQGNQVHVNTERLNKIETSGSSGLLSHETKDEARFMASSDRMEKLEAAVLILQQTPGELKSLAAEMRGLREGQLRIEESLKEHMREYKKTTGQGSMLNDPYAPMPVYGTVLTNLIMMTHDDMDKIYIGY